MVVSRVGFAFSTKFNLARCGRILELCLGGTAPNQHSVCWCTTGWSCETDAYSSNSGFRRATHRVIISIIIRSSVSQFPLPLHGSHRQEEYSQHVPELGRNLWIGATRYGPHASLSKQSRPGRHEMNCQMCCNARRSARLVLEQMDRTSHEPDEAFRLQESQLL